MKLGDTFVKNPISKEDLKKIFIKSYEKNSIQVTLKFSSEIGPQLKGYFSEDKIKPLEDGTYKVEVFFRMMKDLKSLF
jgi:hypothetical protein